MCWERAKLCTPICLNLPNHMLYQNGKLEGELGRRLFVHVCFCVERSRWKRGVKGSVRPPEALSKWLWQLRLKGRQWLQCDAGEKSHAAPSKSLSKTFLQRSCNIPTMLLLLNHGLKCSQCVLGTFCGCCGVPLMSPCLTLSLLKSSFTPPFPSHARFTSIYEVFSMPKVLWCILYVIVLLSYVPHTYFYIYFSTSVFQCL